MTLVAAALLALALVALLAGRGSEGDALLRVRRAGVEVGPAGAGSCSGASYRGSSSVGAVPDATAGAERRWLPRVASGLAGLGALLLLGGAAGVVVGAGLALLGPGVLGRLEPEAARREREQLVDDLPLVLDLLAACLVGGASLPRAAVVVAEAVGGPVGTRLRRVGVALSMGSPPDEAWQALVARDTRADLDPLAPVARTLARAARGGAPVVGAVERLAAESRADRRARGEQAARRAGVLAVAPLGLCFLPAFVLIGVLPVVVGLVGPLLSSL